MESLRFTWLLRMDQGVVEQLLKGRADVNNAKTNNGATVLCLAAQEGHDRVIEQLLKAGADVDKARTDDGAAPLLIAAYQGHGGVVEQLLKAGAKTYDGVCEETPLFVPALFGHEGVVDQLLKAGADPKHQNMPPPCCLPQRSQQDLLTLAQRRSEHGLRWKNRPVECSRKQPSGRGPGLDGTRSIIQ